MINNKRDKGTDLIMTVRGLQVNIIESVPITLHQDKIRQDLLFPEGKTKQMWVS